MRFKKHGHERGKNVVDREVELKDYFGAPLRCEIFDHICTYKKTSREELKRHKIKS